MEVHHPHHPTHRKRWSEYLLEFFMLFFAVTLGFFAENIREHTIISHRLEQNQIAILKDLEKDAITIDSLLVDEKITIGTFDRLLNVLYLFNTKTINQYQLIDSIKALPDIVPKTSTLYVNNSSFKNMQS
ncbi:MAG: hypothetical protein FJX80_17060, partial [Bacteroidetes bacterium]|nr:hypothetical protein [Bacteroidota bacterium]